MHGIVCFRLHGLVFILVRFFMHLDLHGFMRFCLHWIMHVGLHGELFGWVWIVMHRGMHHELWVWVWEWLHSDMRVIMHRDMLRKLLWRMSGELSDGVLQSMHCDLC